MPRLLAVLFVLIALPTCVTFAVLVPPGQVADEPGHVARAAALVQGYVHGERRMVAGPDGQGVVRSGVFVDHNLWHTLFVLPPGRRDKLDAAREAFYRALPWSGERLFTETGPLALYFPVFYLPSAIGLGFAEALRIAPYDAIIVGRLSGALMFMLLGAMALTLARRGRSLLFCALACPMTLSLAASFNQDGLLIATAGLAAALATREGLRARLGAAVAIGCVVAVKLPYLPLVALLLVQPGSSLRRRVSLAALVATPALGWTAAMLATVSSPALRPAYRAGPLWPGDPAAIFTGTDALAQLHVLLVGPARLIWLPATTLMHDPWLFRQAVGVLGWLNVILPEPLYAIWGAAIAAAVVADMLATDGRRCRPRVMLLLACASLAAIWGVYLSQYLVWTDVGLDRVEGPSGRYLLPVLPTLALAVPTMTRAAGRPVVVLARQAAISVPVLAAAAGMVILPAVVVGAYYMR